MALSILLILFSILFDDIETASRDLSQLIGIWLFELGLIDVSMSGSQVPSKIVKFRAGISIEEPENLNKTE